MFSYHKLLNGREEEDADEALVIARQSIAGGVGIQWRRRKYWSWRRKKLRVATLLRRALRGKAARIRSAAGKMMRRFKEARPYAGDLFSGNYLFLQVNPSAAGPYLERSLFRPPPATLLMNRHRAGG